MVTALRKEEWGAIQPDGGTQGALNRALRRQRRKPNQEGEKGLARVGGKPEEGPEGVKGGTGTRSQPSTSRVAGGLIHPGVPGSSSNQDSEKACSIHVWGITHLPKEAMKTVGVGRCLL